jgi:hypothetical protein
MVLFSHSLTNTACLHAANDEELRSISLGQCSSAAEGQVVFLAGVNVNNV